MFSAHRLGGLLLLASVVFAACSSTPTATPSPSPKPAAATPVGPSAPSGSNTLDVGIPVNVATSAALGDYLAGEEGMTLYVFAKDGPDSSKCVDACAETWPPYLIASNEPLTPGEGVTGTVGSFARADGSLQVTYNGQPLYYYSADVSAGDTRGEGIGGVWSVVKRESGVKPSSSPSR